MGLFIFIFITSLCIDILIIFSIVKGMINRIYGEIDQKIQDIKGKKIKIKRVKKPGMAESIYVDRNETIENNNDRIEDMDF